MIKYVGGKIENYSDNNVLVIHYMITLEGIITIARSVWYMQVPRYVHVPNRSYAYVPTYLLALHLHGPRFTTPIFLTVFQIFKNDKHFNFCFCFSLKNYNCIIS